MVPVDQVLRRPVPVVPGVPAGVVVVLSDRERDAEALHRGQQVAGAALGGRFRRGYADRHQARVAARRIARLYPWQRMQAVDACEIRNSTKVDQQRLAAQPVGAERRRHVLGVLVDLQRAGSTRILRGDAGGAAVGVAAQCLDAADREHHRPCQVADVRADGQFVQDVEAGNDLAAGDHPDLLAQATADRCAVHERQRLVDREPQLVGQLDWRGAGTALGTVDGDEIRQGAGLQHGLADRQELAATTDAQLDTDRFAAARLMRPFDELQQSTRGAELQLQGGRQAVFPFGHLADAGDLRIDLRAWQHPAVAGFGALRKLDLDHLHPCAFWWKSPSSKRPSLMRRPK